MSNTFNYGYKPNEEFYMLSMIDNDNVKYIRMPYLTKEQLISELSLVANEGDRYSNIQVMKEDKLDLEVMIASNDGEEIKTTLREEFYGPVYQIASEMFKMAN